MTDARKDSRYWLVQEKTFVPEHVRKYESIISQGNGYMGIRASVEEECPRNCRYTLVAGTFDRREDKNTTELPNSADVMALELAVDGDPLFLTERNIAYYLRSLDLRNGLLTRRFLYQPKDRVTLSFSTERFISLDQLHVTGQRLVLETVEGECDLVLTSGIRADRRHGQPHFVGGQSRESERIVQYSETTHESGIGFVTSAAIRVWHRRADGSRSLLPMTISEGEAQILGHWKIHLYPDESVIMEKLCRIATTRDRDLGEPKLEELLTQEMERTKLLRDQGYRSALDASTAAWHQVWDSRDMQIETVDDTAIADQLAYRFAVYHLTSMAPLHDDRMNIGAKGLSGRGYMGHTFWDTEIYMLPYFIWEDPQGARSLLEYRYNCLKSARENARYHGFKGARFPWEAAWITDRETCPDDHFSRHELHVTADVAYGVYAYHAITHDLDFMLRCGCQILFETAQFWRSRLEYDAAGDRFEIRDVIGPDEFTHEADNNAFTNHLVHLNLELAVRWAEILELEHPEEYHRLDRLLDLKNDVPAWREGADKLYLPQAGLDDILPQDDDFMTLPTIDLTLYRQGQRKFRHDYPYPTYTRLRVSKQADVMVLFLLKEEDFAPHVKRKSLDYYEPLCIHGSSLSLCTYAMLAADCGEMDKALALFEKAKAIDLGDDMRSSDEGIHAASLGGIWQCCVLGFAGVRLCADRLHIRPSFPPHWRRATLRFFWRGQSLLLEVEHGKVHLRVLDGPQQIEVMTRNGLLRGTGELEWHEMQEVDR